MLRRHKRAGIIVLALAAALAAAVAIGRAGADPAVATVPLGQAQMAWGPVLDTRMGHVLIWPLNAGSVRVLDVSTGTLLKPVAIDAAPMAMVRYGLLVNEQLGRVFAVSVPTTGSTPFVGYVIALDARTGRLLYRTPVTLGGTMSSLAVDARARRVFVLGFPDYLPGGATPDPVRDAVRLSILDATTGHLVRSLRLRPERQTGPGVTVGSNPAGVAIDEQSGRIFVTSLGPVDQMHGPAGAGSLQVVDERTGALVRTVPVGMAPFIVALDGPARRALVFNAGGGTVRVPDPWGWVPPWLRRVLPFLPRATSRTRTVPASVTIIDTSRL